MEITLTVDNDSEQGNGVIFSVTALSEPADWDPNIGAVWFDLGEVEQLARGQYVSMTDGVTVKDTWIADIYFDTLDEQNDTAMGRGPADQFARVWIMTDSDEADLEVLVDSAGSWFADFASIGFDIQNVQGSNVVVWDEDGDETMAHLPEPPPVPVLHVVPGWDQVHGHYWEGYVTIMIEKPGTGESYTASAHVSDDPVCDPLVGSPCFDLKGLWDVQPGDIVTMMDEQGYSTTVHATSLAITTTDLSMDTISGTAEAGTEVWVYIHPIWEATRHEIVGPDGNWTADFSVPGDEEGESIVFDLVPGTFGGSKQLENDEYPDDGTTAYWPRDPIFIDGSVTPNPVMIGTDVTITTQFQGYVYDNAISGSPIHLMEFKVYGAVDWTPMDLDNGDPVVTGSGALSIDTPGVYPVRVRAFDPAGAEGGSFLGFLVVYDPEGGFVTGGGWILSELGWCQLDALCASADGKINFGFVSKYKKGASVPTGNTEFNFSAGGLNFHSSTYQWLVINQSGTNALYTGSGTINGEGDYNFMLWAKDADPAYGDTFRIKIWYEDAAGAEIVVYDNGFHQPIGGGNIKIHSGK